MLPSWISRLSDKSSSSKTALSAAAGKVRDDSPAVLARKLSLQRANARAKTLRPESFPDQHLDSQRFLRSIDALYVLSSVGDGTTVSDDSEQTGSSGMGFPPKVDKVSSQSTSDCMDRGSDLWDREFSSMSSYASEQEAGITGRQEGNTGDSTGKDLLGCPSGFQELCFKNALSEDDAGSFGLTFDTDSSSSEAPETTHADRNCENGAAAQHDDNMYSSETRKSCQCRKIIGQNNRQECRECTCRRSCCPVGLPSDLQDMVGDSIVFVKNSYNAYEDFRESMYQMIMEKDLEESMDMEELLYCYLRLNPLELHELIREVFSDVWSEVLMRVR